MVFPVSAQVKPIAGGTSNPMEIDNSDFTQIITDQFTVLFPRNGTKPSFIWWANNATDKAYVVHFKGLIEYAMINGSSFQLKNEAEGNLFEKIIHDVNAYDLTRLGAAQWSLSRAFMASSWLLLASGRLGMDHTHMANISLMLQNAIDELQMLRNSTSNAELITEIDEAIDATNATLVLVNSNASSSSIKDALKDAIDECQEVIRLGMDLAKDFISDMIEQRENLRDLISTFHPAYMPFASCRWEMSDVQNITQGSDTIGISFTLTLAKAPPKFDFAENNVKLVVRIYNASVIESYTVNGQAYSYNVSTGEMKIDFIVSNWSWNFAPLTLKKLNTTMISVSPALALWVDASTFNATGINVENFFQDMDEIRTASLIKTTDVSVGNWHKSLDFKENDSDAEDLNYAHTESGHNIVGKYFKSLPAAKFSLSEEDTLGGFFRFVPFATITDLNGSQSVVDVNASYFSAGNHVRIYICYPYFNGTLTHDPSIGVEGGSDIAKYIVTIGGTTATAVTGIQEIPVITAWGNPYEITLAGVFVAIAAIVMIVVARKFPTFG
jgi:hypothetical protein